VASLDVDSRQQTLTHYVRNRRDWARKHGLQIPHATHFTCRCRAGFGAGKQPAGVRAVPPGGAEVEHDADFLVIDTPGFDTNLTRLAHSLADTLITPINDSLIDLNVIAHFDPVTGEPREMSHYSRLVQRARSSG